MGYYSAAQVILPLLANLAENSNVQNWSETARGLIIEVTGISENQLTAIVIYFQALVALAIIAIVLNLAFALAARSKAGYYFHSHPLRQFEPPELLNTRYIRSSDSMDWDSLKIIDYISVAEDMWRKLDVKDVNCQKRILCELHQNELALGPAASKIVNVFGYARYLSLLNIPEPLKNMIDDYQDAADKGRSMKDQECKQVYDSCDFSIKDTIIKKLKGHQD